MLTDRLWTTVTVLIVAAAAAGCSLSSDRVAGCTALPDDSALLDELAKDPALGVTVSGAKKRAEPKRQEACHKIGKDVARPSVWVDYDVSHDLGPEEVRAAFGQVAGETGWVAMPNTANPSAKVQFYCRDILDQPVLLIVGWEDAKTVGPGESERVPAHLGIVVHGSADAGMTGGAIGDIKASRPGRGLQGLTDREAVTIGESSRRGSPVRAIG